MTDAKKIKSIIEQGEGYRSLYQKVPSEGFWFVLLRTIERVGARIAGEWIIIG